LVLIQFVALVSATFASDAPIHYACSLHEAEQNSLVLGIHAGAFSQLAILLEDLEIESGALYRFI